MSDIKHASMMLDLAGSDRKAIHNMLDKDKFDDEIFDFHAQQAVEKLFKAWLSLCGIAYPCTHDLKALYRLLEDHQEPGLEVFIDLVDLTDFAVQLRYELEKDLEPVNRPELLQAVDKLFAHVKQQVKGASEGEPSC